MDTSFHPTQADSNDSIWAAINTFLTIAHNQQLANWLNWRESLEDKMITSAYIGHTSASTILRIFRMPIYFCNEWTFAGAYLSLSQHWLTSFFNQNFAKQSLHRSASQFTIHH